MAKYLTQSEGLQYVHNGMSAVIRHGSLPRYRGDERRHSLSPPILPLTLPFNFFLSLSLCLSNSPVLGTLLSLFLSVCVSFSAPDCSAQWYTGSSSRPGSLLCCLWKSKVFTSHFLPFLLKISSRLSLSPQTRVPVGWRGKGGVYREEENQGVCEIHFSSCHLSSFPWPKFIIFYCSLFSFLFQSLSMNNDVYNEQYCMCHHDGNLPVCGLNLF